MESLGEYPGLVPPTCLSSSHDHTIPSLFVKTELVEDEFDDIYDGYIPGDFEFSFYPGWIGASLEDLAPNVIAHANLLQAFPSATRAGNRTAIPVDRG